MNKALPVIYPVVSLWLLLVCFGCETNNLEQTAYKTVGAVTITVDASMNAFGDYVRAGQATAEQQATVKTTYERYQQIMKSTHRAVIAYKVAPEDATQLDAALRAFEIAGGELISLIRQFTTPVSP